MLRREQRASRTRLGAEWVVSLYSTPLIGIVEYSVFPSGTPFIAALLVRDSGRDII
jgi:hypothetical protein